MERRAAISWKRAPCLHGMAAAGGMSRQARGGAACVRRRQRKRGAMTDESRHGIQKFMPRVRVQQAAKAGVRAMGRCPPKNRGPRGMARAW